MKLKTWFALVPLLLGLPCAAQIPVTSSIAYDANDPTNAILLSWEAIPGKHYNVMTTTALGQQPWTVLNPSPIYASNNLARFRDPNDQSARFYRIAKVDTEPPELTQSYPWDGAIAVSTQAVLRAWLWDQTGIDTNTLSLTVGTQPAVDLTDPRLTYTNGLVIYTPGPSETLGAPEATVTATLSMADTLGYQTNLSWSFELELETILTENILLLGQGGGARAKSAGATASPALTLLSTNGNEFTYSFTGASSGLSNGLHLVESDLETGYTRTVVSFTEYPSSNVVVAVTRPTRLAELIEQGSVNLRTILQPSGPAPARFGFGRGEASLDFSHTVALDRELYRDANVLVETTPGSQLDLGAQLDIAINIRWFHIDEFEAVVTGTADLNLELRAQASRQWNWGDTIPLVTPIHHFHGGFAGPVPVWTETVLEFNFGWSVDVAVEAEVSAGVSASKTIRLGRRYKEGVGWEPIWDNPPPEFEMIGPEWQVEGTASATAYVQPKMTVLVYSVAGVWADLKPYVEFEGHMELNPPCLNVGLYAGLSSSMGLDLRVWDDDWGELPNRTFDLIPRQELWHETGSEPPVQHMPGMVWIPCGRFTMGSPESEPARWDNETQHEVTISRGFWMGKYEVTQAEYQAVMGSNPSYFQGANLPVETVNWHDAVAYCAGLTAQEQAAGRLPAGWEYRLPTEAQWEYACRAGTTTPFHYGNALRSGMANFYGQYEYPPCGASTHYCYNSSGTYLGQTTSVGSYAPNAWGLFDMHGNVWEWCQDWYGTYPGGSVTDPVGPAMGSSRVFRGGYWFNGAGSCRSAIRNDSATRTTGTASSVSGWCWSQVSHEQKEQRNGAGGAAAARDERRLCLEAEWSRSLLAGFDWPKPGKPRAAVEKSLENRPIVIELTCN